MLASLVKVLRNSCCNWLNVVGECNKQLIVPDKVVVIVSLPATMKAMLFVSVSSTDICSEVFEALCLIAYDSMSGCSSCNCNHSFTFSAAVVVIIRIDSRAEDSVKAVIS